MSLTAPGGALLGLVWQGCQRKSAISEANPFGIVAEHLVSSLDHHALMLGNCLPASFLNALPDDELMNFGHVDTVADLTLTPQPWSLRAEAIRGY